MSESAQLWAILILTVVGAITGIIQAVLQWYMVKELGDLDGTRKDWWEVMEDSERYKGVMRWLRFASGKSNK